MSKEDYTFAAFSSNPFYQNLTDRLIELAEIREGERIVDLACGTGLVTRRIMANLREAGETVIIGIDHSAAALKQAVADLRDARDAAVVFVHSRVENISDAVKEKVDTVFFCNAIHYVPDKGALVDRIAASLKPGGKFVFNTSFYSGPLDDETQLFYRKWMFKARRILRREHGLTIQRLDKVESRRQLTVQEYRELLEGHGFRVEKQEVDPVQVPLQGWLDISLFSDFIEGAMPGVPLDKASMALRKAVRETFEEMKITHTRRNWLDIVAVRV